MCPSPTTAYRTALFPLDFIGFFSTYGTLNFPDCNRYTHPRGGRRDKNQSRTESRQQTPHQNCEDDEGHASHSGPSGVYARSFTSASRSRETCLVLLFLLVLLDESSAGRKDRRKRQKESRYRGTVLLRNDCGQSRDCSAEKETRGILVPFALPNGFEIHTDLQNDAPIPATYTRRLQPRSTIQQWIEMRLAA